MDALEAIADPADVLGPHLAHAILACLSPGELAIASCVSKSWRSLANDDRLWRHHAHELWSTKAYVPAQFKDASSNVKAAYRASIDDACRTRITAEELTGFVWAFRFTALAGSYLQLMDPFWTADGEPMRRHFMPDGSITAPTEDPIWGPDEVKWRFRRSRMGVKGLYVQVNQWPSLDIARTEDWGWAMSNHWVLYRALLPEGSANARALLQGKGPLSEDASDDYSYSSGDEAGSEEEGA